MSFQQETFFRFDKDNSGDMNLFELRDALKSLGNIEPTDIIKGRIHT